MNRAGVAARKIRILVPTFSYPYEPANHYDGKFVQAEVDAYADHGAAVRVLTPYYQGVPETESPRSGVEIRRFHYFFPASKEVLKQPGKPIYQVDSWLARLQVPFILLAMAMMIWRHSHWASVIHAQWTVTALLALPARWLFGTRIVLTARGSDIRLLPAWLNRFIHTRVDAAIDCFGSQPWNETYKKRFPARYLKLPLLVSPGKATDVVPDDLNEIIKFVPADCLVMVYVGRFEELKIRDNQLPLLQLIEAAAQWKRQGLPFRLVYLGSGSLYSVMERLVEEQNVGDVVYLLGSRSNVMDYLQYADLGIGGIAFNAVSQEMTISATAQLLVAGPDNQGTPWQDHRNCLLIKPNDLADLIAVGQWAIANRSTVRVIGTQARQDMHCYMSTPQEGGGKYLQAFAGLLSDSA